MRRFMRRRRHAAKVKDPLEMRMGSPQYGQLILHGEPVPRARDIEFESLVWSGDRRLLAGQELVSWLHEPRTRVVIFELIGAFGLPPHRRCAASVRRFGSRTTRWFTATCKIVKESANCGSRYGVRGFVLVDQSGNRIRVGSGLAE